MLDADGNRQWDDEDDVVQGIVLLRKGEESLPALERRRQPRSRSSTTSPAGCCPGVKIEPYYDRTDLINTTTDTVRENLLVGHGAGDASCC